MPPPVLKPLEPSDTDSHVFPLNDFYTIAGLELPEIQSENGAEIPQPYRSLLVHNDDMTPTLKRFYQQTIHITVLRRHKENGFYFREVVLVLDDTFDRIEFGAIKIDLNCFQAEVTKEILRERLPLGHILAVHGVEHTSEPTAFLKIQSDDLISEALHLSRSQTLYGRRNTLWTPERKPLAEIVEILPPIKKQQRPA